MIIHVAGSTGSGKTFLGRIIKSIYEIDKIVVYDLDDIFTPVLQDEKTASENVKEAHNFVISGITKRIKSVIKKNDNILFVGYDYVVLVGGNEEKKIHSFNDVINPNYKFFINDDILLSFKRYRSRSSNIVYETQIGYYVESYTDWKKIFEDDVRIYTELGYTMLRQPLILRELILIIK